MGDGDKASELFALLNPVNHARTSEEVGRYLVEPYVVAADVYSQPPHTGRGGWTWYTGSSGWMYRVGLESILGVTLRRGAIRVDPCIPRHWPGYEVRIKTAHADYRIVVENPDSVNRGVRRVDIDGIESPGQEFAMVHDGVVHTVRVVLGMRTA